MIEQNNKNVRIISIQVLVIGGYFRYQLAKHILLEFVQFAKMFDEEERKKLFDIECGQILAYNNIG